jgi:hypothetical protein
VRREELLQALQSRAEAAAQAMASATDGASLCSISRSGRRVPGVKYLEGRWAALRALGRAIAAPATDVEGQILALRSQWWTDLQHRQGSADRHWVDYLLGGVDALDEAAELWDAAVARETP